MQKAKSLPGRMLKRYLAIVLFPMLVIYTLSILFAYRQMVETENQRQGFQLSLTQQELVSTLEVVETIPDTLSQNDQLLTYLRYEYSRDWEAVYAYLKNIRPSLRYLLSVTPAVETLTFYGAENMLNLGGYFLPMSRLPGGAATLSTGRWLWLDGTLSYFRPVWNEYSGRKTGVIRLDLSTSVIDALRESYDDGRLSLVDRSGNLLYGEAISPALRKQQAALGRGDVTLVLQYGVRSLVRQPMKTMIYIGALLFLLLITLSLVYLKFSYTIAMRLSRLAEHIRGIRDGEYLTYDSDPEKDEVGLVISAFNDMAHRTDVLVNEVQRAELLRQQAEYNAYQAQIEPHFLYGTLDSIRMMADEKGYTKIANTILQVAKLMRYSLSNDGGEVTLGDELTQVKRYLALQTLRYGRRISHAIAVEDPALTDIPCPQYILQPLVENCLVHGLKDCPAGGKIRIRIGRENEAIRVDVADNGVGVTPEELTRLREKLDGTRRDCPPKSDEHYALYNIHTRLRMYYGAGSGIRMTVNEWGGLTCTLWIVRGKEKT
jgi:two-component system sensor histidine kinase YesM